MKNKLELIKNTWTYQHKLLLVTLALAVAHVWPLIPLPTLQAATIEYQKPPTIVYNLDTDIAARTIKLYEQNKATDLERYRLEAIGDINKELQNKVYESDHVDYDELKTKYGY
jgi:hypothetical protein